MSATDNIVALKSEQRFRICKKDQDMVEILVVREKIGNNPLSGECIDVEGKKIELNGFGKVNRTYSSELGRYKIDFNQDTS